ncbi:ATP-binding protein [Dactylosporangium sp. CA-092794]|uniref:ATP-binding protein n=1 Tax=Dactylosporangium sp. CA-092794 TaxID=3239929 RepID=UPI003D90F236
MPKPIAVTLRRQFAWLVVVLLSLGVARLLAGRFLLDGLDRALAGNAAAAAANHRILADLTDADTGVRDYRGTGDPARLEPYRRGAGDYPLALRDARRYDDPAVRAALQRQDEAAQRWLVRFAIPAASVPPGAPGAGDDAGRDLFDRFRAANRAVDAAVEARRRADAGRFRAAGLALEAALALIALASAGIALRLGRNARRHLVDPLRNLQSVFERLGRGDDTARAAVTGPPEVRALAAAINARLEAAGQARLRLRAQSEYLAQVLDAVDVAVLTCDARGDIVHLNRPARGRRPGGGDPRTIAELDAVRDAADGPHPLARALRGETVDKHEMLLRTPGGADRHLLVDARPLRGADGAIAGAVATGYDVTALREREAELAAFAGIAAHDLKAPLATIAGYAELLADTWDAAVAPEPARLVARVRGGVERMRRLIDDLLAYATARDAPLHLAPVDLDRLVEDVAAERGEAAAAAIERGPLPVVRADPGMFRQLFDNLIGNALKYTAPEHTAEVRIGAEARAGGVRIVVADRGIGIPADQRSRVFTSFHRAHADRGYAGTGLGLAICQRVVARHGGTIVAAGNPGGGTLIAVDLPPAAVVSLASVPPDAAGQSARGAGHEAFT